MPRNLVIVLAVLTMFKFSGALADDIKSAPVPTVSIKDTIMPKTPMGTEEKDIAAIPFQTNEKTIVVLPEIAVPVEMSSMDINRVACPNELQIQDVIFSQEKGVKVKANGSNAFVKFPYRVTNGEKKYATDPTELYIACGENIYNLIVYPKRIPSQTIRLSTGKLKNIKQNASLMGGLPLEKKTLMLIKLAYTDNLPESFDGITPNKNFKIFKGIQLTLKRQVLVEGEGLRLKEYHATNNKDIQPGDDEYLRLNEKDFMLTELTTNTIAIAMDKPNIRKGETTRLFIVESTGGVTNGNK